jgi:hypothetical protein
MGSQENSFAREAVRILKSKNWHIDNSLIGANLWNANLEKARMRNFNLRKVILSRANLKNAYVSQATLRQADLTKANLEGAYFNRSDLSSATLYRANIRGAFFADAILKEVDVELYQLAEVGWLRGAIMPNGNIYDGRLNLETEINWIKEMKINPIDITNDMEMALFYGVSVETFRLGQKWAKENLQEIKSYGNSFYSEWDGTQEEGLEV